MPPLPLTLSSFAAIPFPLDFIRKDDPNLPGAAPLDEQRFETLPSTAGSAEDGRQMDSKLLWQAMPPPFRMFIINELPAAGNPGPGAIFLEDYFNELNSRPDYWNALSWGQVGGFSNNTQFGTPPTGFALFPGGWFVSPSQYPLSPAYQILTPSTSWGLAQIGFGDLYLISCCTWQQRGDSTGPPLYCRAASAFQILCPKFWAPQKYEIWQVSGRWDYRSVLAGDVVPYGDDGYVTSFRNLFPNPPWAASTDFAFVRSGTLNPGQVLTIEPHDFDPIHNCPSPPGPPTPNPNPSKYGQGGYSDWDGWAIGTYLIFTN